MLHSPRIVACVLLSITAGIAPNFSRAQESSRPIALVSVAPTDQVLSNTTYLLQACNVPEMGGLVNLMVNQYTQGLDPSKPIGAAVTLDGQMPSAMIFLPLTDRNAFFGALAGIGVQPDDLGDGLFEINANGQTIFAKDSGGWMFIAQSEEALSSVPADPSAMLGRLPELYDIGIRLNIEALPENIKQTAIDQLKIGFERGMAEQTGQSPEEQAAAREMGEASVEQLVQLIENTEQVFFGWTVNEQQQAAYFDIGAQFIEGSKLAEQADAAVNQTSDYTALMRPDASIRFRASSTIPDADKELTKSNLKNSFSQIERQLAGNDDIPAELKSLIQDLLSGLMEITEGTIDEGILDSAGSVSVSDGTLRVLMGGRVSDGEALAAQVKKTAEQLPESSDAPTFEFDYETYKGVTLHRASIPVKIADPAAKKVFGDALKLVIGTAEKSWLIALDPSGDAFIKAAIDELKDSAAAEVSPFEAVVELDNLLRFAQSVSPNSILDNAIATISEFAGKDKVSINARVIPRGAVYRLAIEEGVMRSVGAAAKSGNSGGGF